MGEHSSQIIQLLVQHIVMTSIAVAFSVVVGVPLGILISYVKKLGKPVMGAANVVQAIPSMALLGLAIPLLGIGKLPAIVMVIIYSLLPIIKNTYTGISGIDPQMVEAANGIGLTKWQVLKKVKIPMALPIIMAGVRISAVTAVGLMTMAAFIGAGGLGYLVFSGIRTVNNLQILSGAIPACALALFVDYIMGLIEKLVTPISLQKKFNSSKEQLKKARFRDKVILIVVFVLIASLIIQSAVSGMKTAQKTITIGGKDFTEQDILCNLYSDLIEDKTDIQVDRKASLGGSQVCFESMKKGEIDMYVDYTGTIYSNILGLPAKSDMDAVYNECASQMSDKYQTRLLNQCGFNNTYTIAMTKETQEKYNITNFQDLAAVSDQLRIATTLEFQNRKGDGLGGLIDKYNLNFQQVMGIDASPRFTALENGDVDLIDAFATDGLLKKYQLVTIKDDDGFFPPYYAVPVINAATIEKYPELEGVINKLGPYLTDEVMQQLNYEVDEEERDPADVALEFYQSIKDQL